MAALLCLASSAKAEEVDRKMLWTMLPCKSAALRLCDRSQGINSAALWKCGATLAERHNEVGQRCLDVLKRYGQL
ncbi:MAG: hypothetical protein WDO17_21520 [Alphaproteobacteria bacterium]